MLRSSKAPRHPHDAPRGALDTYRVQECKHLTLILGPFPKLQPFPHAGSHPSNPQKAQQKFPHSSLQQYEDLLVTQGWEGPLLLWSTNHIFLFEEKSDWTSSLLKYLCWDTVYPFVLKDKYTLHHNQSEPLPSPKSNPVSFRTSPSPGFFFNPMHSLFCPSLWNTLLWISIHLNFQGIWYFGNGLIHLALAFSNHLIL